MFKEIAKKIFVLTLLAAFIYLNSASAQDSLIINGQKYRFIPDVSDTIKSNGNTYIAKYVYQPDEAYVMRSNGKIYVVVTVLATIFAGIFAYLVYLDRRIGRLEKEKNNN